MSPHRIQLRPQVEGEIREAMAWYRERSPGLDQEFYQTFLEVLSMITRSPQMYRLVHGDVRRVVFRRFPYALFYILDETNPEPN